MSLQAVAERRVVLQSPGAEVNASHDSDMGVEPRHESLPDLAHSERRGRFRRMLSHLHRTRPDGGELDGVHRGASKPHGSKLKRRWRQRRADDKGTLTALPSSLKTLSGWSGKKGTGQA